MFEDIINHYENDGSNKVKYYHIETEVHLPIFAGGVLVESLNGDFESCGFIENNI